MYSGRGGFHAVQRLVQEAYDIGENYENDYAKSMKFCFNMYLLTRCRKFQEALNEAGTGIQFISKTGFVFHLFYLYVFKMRAQFMLGDVTGSKETVELAERIKAQTILVPLIMGEFLLIKFILELFQLEEAIKSDDKPALSPHRTNTLRAGTEALKIANKFAFIKTETLKLMGVYFWVIGRQRKAMKWWRKSIQEGQRLNDRLELSRTHYEVRKRLLEPPTSTRNWMVSRQKNTSTRHVLCSKRWTCNGTWMNWRSSGCTWEPEWTTSGKGACDG